MLALIKRHPIKLCIFSLISVLTFYGLYLLQNILNGNFHTVIRNQVYRSAELGPLALSYYVRKHNIKTIINLRGQYSNVAWYRAEIAVANHLHIQHYDIHLQPHKLPSHLQLQHLVALLRHAKKPILVHCKSGADRSGLASAISIILANNHSFDDIEDQISWQYNAVSPNTVGYQVMCNYFAWLKHNNLTIGRSSFLNWLRADKQLKAYHGWFIT